MPRSRALIIAVREYLAMVRTKSFLIGLLAAPTMVVVSMLLTPDGKAPSEGGPRSVAIIDHTGEVAPLLEPVAQSAALELHVHGPDTLDDAQRERLNQQLRAGELAAVLEIGAHAIDGGGTGDDAAVVLVAGNFAGGTTRWLQSTTRRLVQQERLRAAGIEESQIQQLLRGTQVEVRPPPQPDAAEDEDPDWLARTLAPMVSLLLVFVAVMFSAPQLLQSVIEEKQQRISEVLLGSVSPSTLMLGKLLGTSAVGITVLLAYVGMGLVAASQAGLGSVLSPLVIALAVLNVVVALVMFGSLFLAMGAASNDLKDAQGMMTVVIVLLVVPLMTMTSFLDDPHGTLSVSMSLFPFTAPMVMPVRMAITQVPVWQVCASFAGAALTTAVIVWVAGRVFRVGILAQGQAPKLRELARWVLEG